MFSDSSHRVIKRLSIAVAFSSLLCNSPAIAYPDVGVDGTQSGVSTAVQWLLDNRIPYTRWCQAPGCSFGSPYWPTQLLTPNPGLWTTPETVNGASTESWTAKPLSPDSTLGTAIPPYPASPGVSSGSGNAMSYWYQWRTSDANATYFYSFYPDPNQAAALGLVVGDNKSGAISGQKPVDSVEVGGFAQRFIDGWHYTYWFSNAAPINISFEFQLSEDLLHQGIHHEFNIMAANGVFARDTQVLAQAINSHNYDWDDLELSPNGYLMVGFTDVDAPTLATWAIRDDLGGLYVSAGRLPVPTVPELPTIWLMLGGVLPLLRRPTRRACDQGR